MSATRWVWIPLSGGARALAYTYQDPTAGPSARGARVSDPLTVASILAASHRPNETFHNLAALAPLPITEEAARRLGLPAFPWWLEALTREPPPRPPEPEHRRITGQVVHRGQSVAGAQVQTGSLLGAELLVHARSTTDAHGRFEFPPLQSSKDLFVTARSQGLESPPARVPDTNSLRVELLALGTIHGDLRRAGEACAGSIKLTAPDRLIRSVYSDHQGKFLLEGIVPGSYLLKAEALDEGFMPNGDPVFEEIVLNNGETIERSYALRAGAQLDVTITTDDHSSAGVHLLQGHVELPTYLDLLPLLGSREVRSANRISQKDQTIWASFRDIQPGLYTLCVLRWYMKRPTADDTPVACRHLTIADSPLRIALDMPPDFPPLFPPIKPR